MTRSLILGVAASTLIFLSAYGGMVSLAQLLMYGVAGFVIGNCGRRGGEHEGAHARAQSVDRGRGGARDHHHRRPGSRCAVEPNVRHLLPDADADVRRDRLLRLRTGGDPLGLRRHHRHRSAAVARRAGAAVLRRPRSLRARLRRIPRDQARTVRRGARRCSRRSDPDGIAGIPRSAPSHVGLRAGWLRRGHRGCAERLVERADRPEHHFDRRHHRSARRSPSSVASADSRARGSAPWCSSPPTATCAISHSPTSSGSREARFNTVVGLLVLAIVVLSPDGLMGIIISGRDRSRRSPRQSRRPHRPLGQNPSTGSPGEHIVTAVPTAARTNAIRRSNTE